MAETQEVIHQTMQLIEESRAPSAVRIGLHCLFAAPERRTRAGNRTVTRGPALDPEQALKIYPVKSGKREKAVFS
jgi:hypothetical protein